MNKVILFGNVGRIETKEIPSGSIVNLSLATKGKETEWHHCVAFGKTADLISQYVQKGSWLGVEGSLRTRTWESQGHKNYRTEVVIDRVEFGPRTERKEETNMEFRLNKPSSKITKIRQDELDQEDDNLPF